MQSVRFVREPGYTYDLFFLFTLYFNRNHCMKEFANYNKSAEDAKYYERLLADFGTVSEDLLLFFYLGERQHNWISTYYFRPYKKLFWEGTYGLATVQEALTNYDQVVNNVLAHYFENESEETLQQCKESMVVASRLIRESTYEDKVKSALYAFLIDPVPIIQRLSHELMAKEFVLSKQYEQKSQQLTALQEKFDAEEFAVGLKNCGQDSIDINAFDKITLSFCYNHKNLVCMFFSKSKSSILFVLGVDYLAELQYLKQVKLSPKLHEFGLAISEENRVGILQFVHARGEVTIKELEQALELAGTNAYYHVALMTKTGILKTRNRGRTILYSLNPQYLETIGKTILYYTQKRGAQDDEEIMAMPEFDNRA